MISTNGWRLERRINNNGCPGRSRPARKRPARSCDSRSRGPTSFIRKYIFSLDHKVIGLQYYFLALTAVFVGMLLSLLMRIHMVWPGVVFPLIGEIKPETYLSLLTMHGTIMVFFVLTTAPRVDSEITFCPSRSARPTWHFPS